MKNKMNFSPSNNCGEHVDSLNVGPWVIVVGQVLIVGNHFVGVSVF